MRLAFAGTPDVAVTALAALLDAGHEIVAVITRPDAPVGRGRTLQPSPIAVFAEDRGLEVYKPVRLVDLADRLRALAPEAIPVVAYGALVPAALLDVAPHGWINLHFSLLPHWRGAAPVQRAIMAGDGITGASTFRIEAGLDTGPVFGTCPRAIADTDTAGSLLAALAVDGAQLLAQTIANLGRIVPQPQATEDISIAAKLTKEDGRLPWRDPALAVSRRIRGVTPEPGAWTTFADQRVGVAPVLLVPEVTDLAAGDIRYERDRVLVGTGSHAIALTECKPQGKGWMRAVDWARGLRPAPERFETL